VPIGRLVRNGDGGRVRRSGPFGWPGQPLIWRSARYEGSWCGLTRSRVALHQNPVVRLEVGPALQVFGVLGTLYNDL
jgi:hypothetical protein